MPVFVIYQPPAIVQLALGIIIGFQPDAHSGFCQPHHRSGVGAMSGHLGAILKRAVGQKPFVAADQAGGNKFSLKAHEG